MIRRALRVLFVSLTFSASAIDIKSFGAFGDGITDDTAAIQAAINYVISNSLGGVTLEAPAGTYPYSHLSFAPAADFPAAAQTVRIAGPVLPAQALSIVDSSTPLFGGAVFKCIATNGDGFSTSYPFGFFNALTVDLENLTFQFPDNPAGIGLDFRRAYALRLRGVTVYTGRSPRDVIQPTVSGSVGLATPANNNAAFTELDGVAVSGFYTGLELNEHTSGTEVSAWACVQGVTFPAAFHANHLDRLMTVQCPNGIVFTGRSKVVIDEYDIERTTQGWRTAAADIVDPASVGIANITWAATVSGISDSHDLVKVGGTNVLTREVGSSFADTLTLTNYVTYTNYVAVTNPPAGTNLAASLPLVQTGLYASYDAQCVVTGATNRWVDQWTNALHLTASTGAGSVPNDVGGYTSLSFTGTSGGPWYSNEAYSVNQPNEIFVVARVTGNFTDYGAVIDSTSNTVGTRQALAYYVSSGAISFYAGAEVIGPAIPSGAWAVFDMVFNGSSSGLYVNGTQVAAGNVGANSGRGLLVGGIPGYGPKTLMRVARIDAYSGVLDSVSRSNQLNWMATRYGISH